MTSNPFRRSSLKQTTTTAPQTTFNQPSTPPNPFATLHISTPITNTRHVSFASPPVNGSIEPISYPNSPESLYEPQQAYQPVLSYLDHESTSTPISFGNFSFGNVANSFDAETLDGTVKAAEQVPLAGSDTGLPLDHNDDSYFSSTRPYDHDDVPATSSSSQRDQSDVGSIKPFSRESIDSGTNHIDVDTFTRLLLGTDPKSTSVRSQNRPIDSFNTLARAVTQPDTHSQDEPSKPSQSYDHASYHFGDHDQVSDQIHNEPYPDSSTDTFEARFPSLLTSTSNSTPTTTFSTATDSHYDSNASRNISTNTPSTATTSILPTISASAPPPPIRRRSSKFTPIITNTGSSSPTNSRRSSVEPRVVPPPVPPPRRGRKLVQ